MRRSIIRPTPALPALLALLSIPLPGCSIMTQSPALARTTVDRTVDHVAGAPLVVNSRNGRVEVIASPEHENVAIFASITCGGATQAEAQKRLGETTLRIARDGRGLVVEPVFAGGPRNGDAAGITVHLPDAHGVRIDTSNGRVDVSGTSGSLVVDTSNGAVRVENHAGAVRIDTSNARVEAIDVAGPVNIDTSNASISLVLAADGRGPIRADTSNGRVDATLGPGFSGAISLDTSNGSVMINDRVGRVSRQEMTAKDHAHVMVGAAGDAPGSVIDTSNASIALTVN